jgi:hypothetical protein
MPKTARITSERPAPTRPAKPSISPFLTWKAYVFQKIGVQIFYFQSDIGNLCFFFCKQVIDFPAYHHVDNALFFNFILWRRPTISPSRMNNNFICNTGYFIHAVGYETIATLSFSQLIDYLKQVLLFGVCQGMMWAHP